jgi:hypothetical protein
MLITAQGQLDSLILYLRATQHYLSRSSYDPCVYIYLSRIVSKIGFTDIGTSYAYRAILLIEGFQIRDPDIYHHVREVVSKRLRSQSPLIIEDELQSQHLHAYRELLNGMLGCGCFWDGVVAAKKALGLFPGDPDLLEIRQWLKDGFTDRCDGLKKLGANPQDLVFRSRVGKYTRSLIPGWIRIFPNENRHWFALSTRTLELVIVKLGRLFSASSSTSTSEHKNQRPAGRWTSRCVCYPRYSTRRVGSRRSMPYSCLGCPF